MKAVLYPFTKSTHALIRFRELLDYKITSVIDFAFSIGEDAGEVIQYKQAGILITSDVDKALEEADILILTEPGSCLDHTKEVFIKYNIQEKFMNMLKIAFEKNIKMVSVYPIMNLPMYKEWLAENKIHVEEFSYIKSKEEIQQIIDSYEDIKTEKNMIKIGIFGIRSCIGKMTAQLNLYTEFKKDRKVFPFITEEISDLFKHPGLSYFQVEKMEFNEIDKYINSLLNSYEKEENQYFIMADQGGIATVHVDAMMPLLLKRIFLLKKIQFHEGILIVDYEDDRLIEDSLVILRRFIGIQKPIAFLLPDRVEIKYGEYVKKTEEEIQQRIKELKEKFDVSIVETIQNIHKVKELIIKKYEK